MSALTILANNASAIIGACWLAFLVAWAILAMTYRSSGRRSHSSPGRSALRLLMVVALMLTIRYGGGEQLFGEHAATVAAAGSLVCIVGLAFAIWARVALGRSWGMPMSQHDNPELITSGPYRFVRHPIYTGMTGMFIGTSLVFPIAALPSALTVVYTALAARREERDMAQRFPDTYPEYKKRSKFLIPFLL